ncbi:branched-chain amino acid transaminase [Acrocarpospora catenulata]|uniref:branched-chain amino acid transaminase n=1 Tax=Acrocarpospora catenulata TaxID=2836182 RepID=UPI001BDA5801|nr:branched-chain amino acid transaminase [Acrocarpospora catenulata]
MTTPRVIPWAYHEGRFVPLADARVPVTTQALQYGTGVFEGIRAYRQPDGGLALFRADDHYRRLLDSCAMLRIEVGLTVEELCAITAELLGRAGPDGGDVYVRPLAYKLRLLPGTPPGVQLRGVSDAFSINAFEMGSYTDKQGIRCALSAWRRPPEDVLPVRAKITGGYVNNALALDDARASGYADAILLNTRGQVAEATTANVLAVRQGTLVTPPASAGILAGITRDTVLTLASDLGVPAEVRELTRDDLFTAEEVFLAGTGAEIVPVIELAGRAIGSGRPGPVTTSLAAAYTDVVRGRNPRHAAWLRPVAELVAR